MFGEKKAADTELTVIIQPLLQTQLFFCQHDNSIDPSFFRLVSMFMDSGCINISNCCIQPSSCQFEPHFLEFTTVSSVVLHGLQMHHINSVLAAVRSLIVHSNGRCKGRSFYFLIPLKSAQLKQGWRDYSAGCHGESANLSVTRKATCFHT